MLISFPFLLSFFTLFLSPSFLPPSLPSSLPSFPPSFSPFPFAGRESATQDQKRGPSQLFLIAKVLCPLNYSQPQPVTRSASVFSHFFFSAPFASTTDQVYLLFPMLVCLKSNYSAVCLMVDMYFIASQQQRELVRTGKPGSPPGSKNAKKWC